MKRYLRLRLREGRRERVVVSGCRSVEELDARCALIRRVADQLVAAGRSDKVKDFGVQLGAASSPRLVDLVVRAAKHLIDTDSRAPEEVTFRDHALDWTSGKLAERWPDYVKVVDHGNDKTRLRLYILPLVGDVPLVAFALLDAERVMRRLPPDLSGSSRRHVAQVMYRLLKLAVYPCRLIERNPLPQGFLPRVGPGKARQYLYPDEDARLMACTTIPVAYRLAYGILAREGMRPGELVGNKKTGVSPMGWNAIDVARGMVRLDENKTNDPRAWALSPDVAAVLQWWKRVSPSVLLPGVDSNGFARRFRAHLLEAGVDRPELTNPATAARARIRGHDLRATFVTIALANGKAEGWITDRTGHKSSQMVHRYRRLARQFAELGLGPLRPLDQLVPEFSNCGWATSGPRRRESGEGVA